MGLSFPLPPTQIARLRAVPEWAWPAPQGSDGDGWVDAAWEVEHVLREAHPPAVTCEVLVLSPADGAALGARR